MGAWGYRTFENDAAADWLQDWADSDSASFIFRPLRRAARSKLCVDLDDAIESLAAAEILVAARQSKPSGPGLGEDAIAAIHRLALIPRNADLNLALQAIRKVADASELRDSWKNSSDFPKWLNHVRRLETRLRAAVKLPLPKRVKPPREKQTDLPLLMRRVAATKDPALRATLRRKLLALADLNRSLKSKGYNPLTPLQWAANANLLSESRLLIARGAAVNARDDVMAPAVVFAAQKNFVSMVKLLLDAGADRARALIAAVSEDRLKVLKAFLKLPQDYALRSAFKGTLLHEAASAGALKSLTYLIEIGFDLAARDCLGHTPLLTAVDTANVRSARILLSHRSDPYARSKDGKNAFDLAAEVAAYEPRMVKLLDTYSSNKRH